jgi:hypothetical protein
MSQLKTIQTEEAFRTLLPADRAILFFWVGWSIHPHRVQSVVEKWLDAHRPSVEVHRVDPDELPLVQQWLVDQGKESLAYSGSGGIAWLRAGRLVADLTLYDLRRGPELLEGYTRDTFGPLPFRPANLAPGWRAWNEGIIEKLAWASYEVLKKGDTLDPDHLAILADALEEAGVAGAEILDHLRGPGPHFRGCWAVETAIAPEAPQAEHVQGDR